ncbi:MAG: MBL fold metallo-hydrolase [Deltaproteobacteria bacterium]|nr:MBL fold metallo-hydrolase [Deltaproteobacteria bacterium]
MSRLAFRFWGVRGSLPSAGAKTVRYGGNTPCLEVRAGDELFIVDMGSGLRPLGEALGFGPHAATVLMTHYHYDHVQGLPFFGPMYNPKNRFAIYGPPYEGKPVREVLAGQMVRPYFPVGLEVIQAQLDFRDVLPEQTLKFGEATVRTTALNHPGGSLGYRFELGGKAICYCTDVEHDGGAGDARVEAFARGADWFIIDAMYTPDEYLGKVGGSKRGFGHSTPEFAVKVAKSAGVKNLILCHHDPSRGDDALEAIVANTREEFPATTAARELELIEV